MWVGAPGIVSGIFTVMQTVCGSLHAGAVASRITGASITMVEPKLGPESTGVASGVPHPPNQRPATTATDQQLSDFIGFSTLIALGPSSAVQNEYCSPKSKVARLAEMSSTLLGSDPPALAA